MPGLDLPLCRAFDLLGQVSVWSVTKRPTQMGMSRECGVWGQIGANVRSKLSDNMCAIRMIGLGAIASYLNMDCGRLALPASLPLPNMNAS